MPEEEKEPRTKGTRLIAFSACGMILSYGLCRIGVYEDRNIHDGALEPSTPLEGSASSSAP